MEPFCTIVRPFSNLFRPFSDLFWKRPILNKNYMTGTLWPLCLLCWRSVENLNTGNISKDSWYLIPVWVSMESACCKTSQGSGQDVQLRHLEYSVGGGCCLGLAEQQGTNEDAQPVIWNLLQSFKRACSPPLHTVPQELRMWLETR